MSNYIEIFLLLNFQYILRAITNLREVRFPDDLPSALNQIFNCFQCLLSNTKIICFLQSLFSSFVLSQQPNNRFYTSHIFKMSTPLNSI